MSKASSHLIVNNIPRRAAEEGLGGGGEGTGMQMARDETEDGMKEAG